MWILALALALAAKEPAPLKPDMAALFRNTAPSAVIDQIQARCRAGGLRIRRVNSVTVSCDTGDMLAETTDGSLRAGKEPSEGYARSKSFVFTAVANNADAIVFERASTMIDTPVAMAKRAHELEEGHSQRESAAVKAFLVSIGGELLDLDDDANSIKR